MDMKKIGMLMGLCMGASMSLALSLVGNLTGGHFTVKGWLISFLVSFVISVVIGLFVPMKRVGDAAVSKLGAQPRTLKARVIEACVSDLIYTPIMTIIMVAMAHRQASAHGADVPPYIIMLLPSLGICLVVGFVLAFILQPLFFRLLTKGQPPRPPRD
ncbi:MAG: hypothetical protein IJ737_06530 [Ruminococcus sp.]|nr:hypothetical protein [Ruminococcus sp.]